jgi:hypothetical protein
MNQSTEHLNRIVLKLCPYLVLVQPVERDGYIELLYKGDSPTFLTNTDTCSVYNLLRSLSVGKRYIRKEKTVPWLWSISTFARKGMTLDETIKTVEKELMGKTEQTTPKQEERLSAIERMPVLASIDISWLRNEIKPKRNPKTGKIGRGIYNRFSTANQEEMAEALEAGIVAG